MGRPYKYTPEQLEQKFIDYIQWNKSENKFYKRELIKSGEKAGEIIDIDTTPPLTIVGFCVFCEISTRIFFDWLCDESNELFHISTRIREQIQLNQVSGACLELFNPSIIARLNGLNDTINVNTEPSAPIISVTFPEFKKD